jgi:hypothetical protein
MLLSFDFSAMRTEICALSFVNSNGPGLYQHSPPFSQVVKCSHAIAVMTAPAVAPEAPKHAIVEKEGRAPFVFAITSGETPVA